MSVVKTYEISFQAGDYQICTLKVDGHNVRQVQKLGDRLAPELLDALVDHYKTIGFGYGPREVRAIVNIKK